MVVVVWPFVLEIDIVAVQVADVVPSRVQVSVSVTTAELKGVVFVAMYVAASSVIVASYRFICSQYVLMLELHRLVGGNVQGSVDHM